jgi:magnesium chelatase subunit D
MAFSHTASASPCASLSHLQSCSLLLPAFKLRRPLLLSKGFDGRRTRIRVTASATAVVESGNGALITEQDSYYGRQFFPLAAVVGQVKSLLSSFSIEQCRFALFIYLVANFLPIGYL